MLIAAIVFFALAALLGLYLLTYVLQGKETPKAVAFIHGPLAVVGLLLLAVYSYYHSPAPWISIVLFVLTAFGGLMLIYKDLTGNPVPKGLAMGHGLSAVVAFLFLVVFAVLQ